jgi:hypothetical protein
LHLATSAFRLKSWALQSILKHMQAPFPAMPLPFRWLIAATALWLACSAWAQTRPAAPRPAAPAGNCLVSEFRGMALGTHDVAERGRQATEWLRRNASACSEDQLRLISSNRSAWMGTADTPQLMGLVDGALEARLKNQPEKLLQMFAAAPQRASGSETMRSGELAPRPAPVVTGTPAVVTAAPPPVPVPGAAAGPTGATPPPPGGTPPPPGGTTSNTAPAKAPEVGKHFSTELRGAVREHFTANRGNGPCPPGVVLKSGRCEAAQSERVWKIGQPLASGSSLKELPATLLEKLGPAPANHRYVQLDADLLLIHNDTRMVVDAVLDLGQVAPKT